MLTSDTLKIEHHPSEVILLSKNLTFIFAMHYVTINIYLSFLCVVFSFLLLALNENVRTYNISVLNTADENINRAHSFAWQRRIRHSMQPRVTIVVVRYISDLCIFAVPLELSLVRACFWRALYFMLLYALRRAQTWRLHTKLYKSG